MAAKGARWAYAPLLAAALGVALLLVGPATWVSYSLANVSSTGTLPAAGPTAATALASGAPGGGFTGGFPGGGFNGTQPEGSGGFGPPGGFGQSSSRQRVARAGLARSPTDRAAMAPGRR